MRSFLRITLSIDVDIVTGGKPTKQFKKRAKLVTPERKNSAVLLQDDFISSAADKLMDALEEINNEHEEASFQADS